MHRKRVSRRFRDTLIYCRYTYQTIHIRASRSFTDAERVSLAQIRFHRALSQFF